MWNKLEGEELDRFVITPDIAYELEGIFVLGFPPSNTFTCDEYELGDLFDLVYDYDTRKYWNFWFVVTWYENPNGVRIAVPLDCMWRYDDEPLLYEIDISKFKKRVELIKVGKTW